MAKAKSITCITKLKALADETRWRVVQELLKKPATVNELTSRMKATQYNVSKHLRILREAGIVSQTKIGIHVHCEIVPEFKLRLAKSKNQLDLGCCVFKFD
jgi:DNA-binding transcriptional ArsR family regulator